MKRFLFYGTMALFIVLTLIGAPTLSAAPEAAFTVNTTALVGDGVCNATACTIFEAINAANATAVKDQIKFNIPAATDPGCNAGTGVCTIALRGALPELTAPVIIDGYSQPGASKNTLAVGMNTQIKIALEGQYTKGDLNPIFEALVVKGGKSVIQGLSLTKLLWGIDLESDDNRVRGNFIGMKPDGITPQANWAGVHTSFDVSSDNNQIGGANVADRNLISGNHFYGIYNSGHTGTTVQGNYIGTDKSGITAVGGGLDAGILSTGFEDGLLIGGFQPGEGNVIGDAFTAGIHLYPLQSSIQVIGNNIGIGADNQTAIGNGIGIWLNGGSETESNVQVTLNRIARNSQEGVRNTCCTNIALSRNSIYRNGALGIDLDLDLGVTPNDPQDTDVGPNGLQNFPVLTEVTPNRNGTTIKGKLNSTPKTTFRIEFFANPACDSSQHGEGKNYLGDQVVQTNSNGKVNFTFQTTKVLLAGTKVTATATSAAGNGTPLNTSEFSRCKLLE